MDQNYGSICDSAVGAGDQAVPVLEWVKQKTVDIGEPAPWTSMSTMMAGQCGNLAALQWLLAHGCECEDNACLPAIMNGHCSPGRV
jgi:hypothetical protein